MNILKENKINPLVSIIVRTVSRPQLPEALDCIINQSYSNIEIIVVDALGQNQLVLDEYKGKFPIRIVSKNRKLTIPEAANAGLKAVTGDFFGFLDEDDLIDKNHISDLLESLFDEEAIAAYSNIEMTNPEGEHLRDFNEEFSFERLLVGNFIPIHALLIRSTVLEHNCKPDENLEIYDDWDFLLQIAQLGKFIHLNKTSGIYRNFNTSGVNHNNEMIRNYRKLIYAKWKKKLTHEAYLNLIDYLINQYGQREISNYREQLETTERKLFDELNKNHQLQADLMTKQQEISSVIKTLHKEQERSKRLNDELIHAEHTIREIKNSISWKLTYPFRKMIELIRNQFL